VQATPQRRHIRQPAVAAPASEHLIEKRLLNYLRTSSFTVQFKMGVDGWPDRIICYRGCFIGIEIKSERIGHNATARQQQRLQQIQRAGGLVGVVRSKEEVIDLLHTIDAWYERTGGLPWAQHSRLVRS
jgi:hypothetical protein